MILLILINLRISVVTTRNQNFISLGISNSSSSRALVVMCGKVRVALQVYVCAPEVLMLFTDNFDYQVRPTATLIACCNGLHLVVCGP